MTSRSPYIDIEVHTDYLVAPDAERLLTSTIRFPSGEIRLNDLMRTKLAQEIQAFNERSGTLYGAEYLPADELASVRAEGERYLGSTVFKGKANPNTEFKLLLRALAERKFKVVIDGLDHFDPDDRVYLDRQTGIVFVRLFPWRT